MALPPMMPEAWLLITRQKMHWGERRWRWAVLNEVAYEWAHGTARSFSEARDAAQLRARLGPNGPLPRSPDPGLPERWPDVNLIPYSTGPYDGTHDG
jgi:hypothetical protein